MKDVNDSEFLQEVKELTNPETVAKKTKDNREAIRHLAQQIAKLKNKDRARKRKPVQRSREPELSQREQLEQLLKEREEAITQREENSETQQEQEQTEFECPECGDTFSTKKKRDGHYGGSHKDKIQEEKKDLQLRSREEAIVNKLREEGRWMTSKELAEEIDHLNTQQVRNQYDSLKQKQLIDTNKNLGIKLEEVDVGKNSSKPDSEYECLLCGEEYDHGQGFGSHLRYVHDIHGSDFDEETRPSNKMNAVGKTDSEIRDVKERIGSVKTPKNQDGEFPKFERDEENVAADTYSIPERKILTKRILRDADKPLTRNEISQRIFNLDRKPQSGETHYNVISSYIKEMEDAGAITEAERMDTGGKAYALSGSSNDVGTLKDQVGEKEFDEEVKESEATYRLTEILDKDKSARREFNSLKNTFTKIIHQEDQDEVTYYDFSGNYGGEQQAMDAWRNLFSSPTILNGVRKEVCPERSLKWERKGDKNTPSNWVLKLD